MSVPMENAGMIRPSGFRTVDGEVQYERLLRWRSRPQTSADATDDSWEEMWLPEELVQSKICGFRIVDDMETQELLATAISCARAPLARIYPKYIIRPFNLQKGVVHPTEEQIFDHRPSPIPALDGSQQLEYYFKVDAFGSEEWFWLPAELLPPSTIARYSEKCASSFDVPAEPEHVDPFDHGHLKPTDQKPEMPSEIFQRPPNALEEKRVITESMGPFSIAKPAGEKSLHTISESAHSDRGLVIRDERQQPSDLSKIPVETIICPTSDLTQGRTAESRTVAEVTCDVIHSTSHSSSVPGQEAMRLNSGNAQVTDSEPSLLPEAAVKVPVLPISGLEQGRKPESIEACTVTEMTNDVDDIVKSVRFLVRYSDQRLPEREAVRYDECWKYCPQLVSAYFACLGFAPELLTSPT